MQIQIASSTMFGIGIQAAHNVPRYNNAFFRYFPFTSAPYGVNQPTANLPLESGRTITPRGSYKSGVWGAGQVSLLPRFTDDIGYLLLALMGRDMYPDEVTAADGLGADHDIAGASLSGLATHTFVYNVKESNLPYVTTRRVLEGPTNLGEQIVDARIANAEINIPNTGVMTANLELMGRIPSTSDLFIPDPDTTWAMSSANPFDDDAAYALSVDPLSSVTIMGGSVPCTGLSLTVSNNLLSPDQARIVGSQTPLDFPVLSRNITIQATVLVTDYDLYRDLTAGGHTSADKKWSAAIKRGNVDFRVYSPFSFSTPTAQAAFQFKTTSGNVDWSVRGTPNYQAGQPVVMTLVGNVQRQSTGHYAELRFQNKTLASYKPYIASVVGTGVTFTANHILDAGSGFTGIAAGDKVVVTGATTNNGVFTVTNAAAGDLTVSETLTAENGLAGTTVLC